MKLTVFGSRGSMPVFGEAYNIIGHDTSCYVIKDGEKALIIDCGSGLIHAVSALQDCKEIDVVLSHVHYDHCMGLFETVSFFKDRNADYYGSFEKWKEESIVRENLEDYDRFRAIYYKRPEEKNKKGESLINLDDFLSGTVHNTEQGQKYKLKTGYTISFRNSIHQNETSMIDIEKDGKRICFSSDYEHKEGSGIVEWAKDCDLLIFDGSYAEEDYVRYMGWGHSKYEDGCKIANEANAKQLLITHFAPFYNDEMLIENEKKAKNIFANVSFAKQNQTYEV